MPSRDKSDEGAQHHASEFYSKSQKLLQREWSHAGDFLQGKLTRAACTGRHAGLKDEKELAGCLRGWRVVFLRRDGSTGQGGVRKQTVSHDKAVISPRGGEKAQQACGMSPLRVTSFCEGRAYREQVQKWSGQSTTQRVHRREEKARPGAGRTAREETTGTRVVGSRALGRGGWQAWGEREEDSRRTQMLAPRTAQHQRRR